MFCVSDFSFFSGVKALNVNWEEYLNYGWYISFYRVEIRKSFCGKQLQ